MSREITRQFNRAKRKGWLPHFVSASETITRDYFDAADLLAIASRETNLDPKWLTKPGDGGHGYGLMQADDRSFPRWIRTGKWRQADTSIIMGATVLMQKFKQVKKSQGKQLKVKSSRSGKWHKFQGRQISSGSLQRVAIADYNAGLWGYYAYSRRKSIDAYTTGKDYSADVINRAKQFRTLIKRWQKDKLAKPKPRPIPPTAHHVIAAEPHQIAAVGVDESSGTITTSTQDDSAPSFPGAGAGGTWDEIKDTASGAKEKLQDFNENAEVATGTLRNVAELKAAFVPVAGGAPSDVPLRNPASKPSKDSVIKGWLGQITYIFMVAYGAVVEYWYLVLGGVALGAIVYGFIHYSKARSREREKENKENLANPNRINVVDDEIYNPNGRYIIG